MILRLSIVAFALPLSAAPVDFVRDVRPIFQRHCYDCHSEKKQKSGLRLDIKSSALKGGDRHAPDIIAGELTKSPLLKFVRGDKKDLLMPPKGERLSSSELTILTSWIQQGAVWPDGVDLAKLEDKRDHWSFKPLGAQSSSFKSQIPQSIDDFIKAKLKENNLALSPEADHVAWLRRVCFDLIGLPPTPEQVSAFTQSAIQNPDSAMATVVDDLLKSPRYGERWAQHWLDVVRYADTHGFEVNTERPNAWPYRDYVIDAFNNDTPYDQFIREQIVGDAMGKDAATGFLVTASVLLPGQIGKDEPSKRLARQDSLDEIVVNLGQTFLGLSIGCARCHDHKFDPIPQRDYYAMQAFVAGVEYEDRELRTPEAEANRALAKQLATKIANIDKQLALFVPLAKSGAERPALNAKMNTDRFAPIKARRVRFTIRETNSLEPCIDELEVFDTDGTNIALASAGTTATSSGDIIVANRHELRHINDGSYGNSRSWMSDQKGKGWIALEFPKAHTIDRVVWGRDREGKFKDRLATSYVIEVADDSGEWRVMADSTDRQPVEPAPKANAKAKPATFSAVGLTDKEAKEAQRLMAEKKPLQTQLAAASNEQKAFAGTFRTPDEIHMLSRGDPEQPKDEVIPAALSALGDLKLPKETAEQDRRKALANWIASPQNPLTARVMVNRIWQGHFGTGLVETASDFGHSGLKPTHPELLDWLAKEFIRSGWSVKHMHRLIVLSAAYRQSSLEQGAWSKGPEGKGSDALTHMPHATSPMLADADARLLWRYPSRRLEAEVIRDSILAVSGQLNVKMHGRGFDLFDKRGGLTGFTPVESFTGDGLRRMIYAHKVRREREAVFGAFDCPDAGQSTARRRESTTPIQALNLFNSTFTIEQSEAFAARVKKEGGDARQQIQRAYLLALSRTPSADELADSLPIVTTHGLATLCRALFNSNEFLFVP
jgi:hypothetical protein